MAMLVPDVESDSEVETFHRQPLQQPIRMSRNEPERNQTGRPAAMVTPNIYDQLRREESSMDPDLVRTRQLMRHLISIFKEYRAHMPRNILLIGQPGHGKSALINLLHSALRERYEAITTPGDGDTESHTNHLRFFDNFGLGENLGDFLRRCGLPKDYRLPTLVDMPGIVNDVNVIQDILYGLVPRDTDLRKIMKGEAEYVPVDRETAKERAIDRVVFVVHIKRDVSEILKKIFWVVNGGGGDGRPTIPHTLVFTHIDEASNPRSKEEKAVIDGLVSALQLSAEENFRVSEVENYWKKDPVDPERITVYKTNLKKQANGLTVLCHLLRSMDKIEPQKQPAELKKIEPLERNQPEEMTEPPKIPAVTDAAGGDPPVRESRIMSPRLIQKLLLCIAILMVPVSYILFVFINLESEENLLVRKNPSHLLTILQQHLQKFSKMFQRAEKKV